MRPLAEIWGLVSLIFPHYSFQLIRRLVGPLNFHETRAMKWRSRFETSDAHAYTEHSLEAVRWVVTNNDMLQCIPQ